MQTSALSVVRKKIAGCGAPFRRTFRAVSAHVSSDRRFADPQHLRRLPLAQSLAALSNRLCEHLRIFAARSRGKLSANGALIDFSAIHRFPDGRHMPFRLERR
jgi:hypothetical protein